MSASQKKPKTWQAEFGGIYAGPLSPTFGSSRELKRYITEAFPRGIRYVPSSRQGIEQVRFSIGPIDIVEEALGGAKIERPNFDQACAMVRDSIELKQLAKAGDYLLEHAFKERSYGLHYSPPAQLFQRERAAIAEAERNVCHTRSLEAVTFDGALWFVAGAYLLKSASQRRSGKERELSLRRIVEDESCAPAEFRPGIHRPPAGGQFHMVHGMWPKWLYDARYVHAVEQARGGAVTWWRSGPQSYSPLVPFLQARAANGEVVGVVAAAHGDELHAVGER